MIINNKTKLLIGLGVGGLLIAGYFLLSAKNKNDIEILIIAPVKGTIKTVIASTGTVQPQNRLEIKPPVDGRIETILVKEGDKVYQGMILAWMSSKERAALIDSARAKGSESFAYWNNVYKPIPLVAPISGMVIVRSVEPGQSVSSVSAVLVLSNRLIVKADVDETDIGRVKLGQKTIITLDAYQNIKVPASVNHISFESKIVNNVTVYAVDIVPEKVPPVFRSGMSATVEIVEVMKNDIILIPQEAVKQKGDVKYVFVLKDGKKTRRHITTGLTDDKHIEVMGLTLEDKIIVSRKKFDATGKKKPQNPFSPFKGKK